MQLNLTIYNIWSIPLEYQFLFIVSILSCQCPVHILTEYIPQIFPLFIRYIEHISNQIWRYFKKNRDNITLPLFQPYLTHIIELSYKYFTNSLFHDFTISLISISQLSHLYLTKITATSQTYRMNKLNLILRISQLVIYHQYLINIWLTYNFVFLKSICHI